jgi:hypothetical protein
VDGVETERDPRVDEQNAQPEEKCASARDGGGRNLKRHQRAEEDAERDQANEDRTRSFIFTSGTSTEAFERHYIHARFQYSPDEKVDRQDIQQHRLVSEKRLHALRPFRLCRFPRAMLPVGVIQRADQCLPQPVRPLVSLLYERQTKCSNGQSV